MKLENYPQPLPDNCILFHMTDGIYGNFTGLGKELSEPRIYDNSNLKKSKSRNSSPSSRSTSSVEALMKLKNLDEVIQDAISTRNTLVDQIQTVLDNNKAATDTVVAETTAQASLVATRAAINATKKQIAKAKSQNTQLRTSIASRRGALLAGKKAQEESCQSLKSAEKALESRLNESQTIENNIGGHIHRVCEDIAHIFPIEPIPGKPLCFSILDNYLPNADFSSPLANESATAAALGYVAFVLDQLSVYLSIALPYPLKPFASSSSVCDPISIQVAKTSREYPLFQAGSVAYRFEYGVFLLNKDLETLMARKGVRILDLRNTLPNLKYLLSVLEGGDVRLPIRKVGGVKGLSSRSGSDGLQRGLNGKPGKYHEGKDAKEREGHSNGGQENVIINLRPNGKIEDGEIKSPATRVLEDTSYGSGFASRRMARKWLEAVKQT